MSVTVKHPFVSAVPDSADTSLVRPSNWNADHTIIGLGTAAELNAGVANGVATLDSGGKVPVSELPAAVLGALSYQGTWNASTNTPTLASGVGTKGYYYVVSVAGSTNLDGVTDWLVGDWAVYNGTIWQKVDNTDQVTSVNGYTGTVVLTQTDISGTANAPTNTNITSMTGVTGGISSPDYVQFDTTVSVTEAVAKLQWDDGNGTLQFGLKGGNVNLQVGQEIVALCYNDSGVALTDGQIVYISGAQGNRVAVKLALATTDGTSAGTLGMVTEAIAIGGEGFITILGTVNGLNTATLTAGAIVYLSPTVAGAYTTTKPVAPQHTVTLGYVERVHATVGSIYVKVDNGYELDELHNVLITSPTSGNTLIYDASANVWKNANITAGTGISVTNGAGSITVANTGVTSVGGTGTVNGITLTGTVTTSGNLTLGGTLSGVDLTTQVTGTLPVANGGTGITSLTANRVPYGNGTSALGNEADFTYDPSLNTLTAPQISASNGLVVNSATVAASYSIPSGSNAMSAGPVAVSSGITVTVPSGSVWTIV